MGFIWGLRCSKRFQFHAGILSICCDPTAQWSITQVIVMAIARVIVMAITTTLVVVKAVPIDIPMVVVKAATPIAIPLAALIANRVFHWVRLVLSVILIWGA